MVSGKADVHPTHQRLHLPNASFEEFSSACWLREVYCLLFFLTLLALSTHISSFIQMWALFWIWRNYEWTYAEFWLQSPVGCFCCLRNFSSFQITIGIHTGEVVTGVIGQRMPRYCLFGNTVNLTSRTETTGEKGRINVSEYTYR